LDLTAQSLEGWKEEGKEGRREGRRRRWKVYAGCLSAEGRTTLARETTEAVKEGGSEEWADVYLPALPPSLPLSSPF